MFPVEQIPRTLRLYIKMRIKYLALSVTLNGGSHAGVGKPEARFPYTTEPCRPE